MDLNQSVWVNNIKNDPGSKIIDVRTKYEVFEGVIPNAIHIDIHGGQSFLDEINKLDKEKSYYIYCKSGIRSSQACLLMNQLGFTNTFNLIGGFSEWSGEIVNL